jgi:hypothetical protein
MVLNVGDVVEITILYEIVMQNLQTEETGWTVQRCNMKRKAHEWKNIKRIPTRLR